MQELGVVLILEKKHRISFIRPKAWPLANRIVDGVIQNQFSDQRVDVFDVSGMIRKSPDIMLRNSLATFALYGPDIVRRKKKFRLAFWRTPYIFEQIKKVLQERISPADYWFSFQMQSLFDASVPGLPHFIYTDHTHLENRQYTGEAQDALYSQRWITLEKTIYQNATLNFVRSSNVQRSMLVDYSCATAKVKLVYAGSNVVVNARKADDADYAQPHILFIGFDWKRKGGDDLVKAFKLVLERCPGVRLTIVGAKPDLQLPNCDVIGPGQPENLDQYYQRATVFCMPTYREPFGIVFVEAMAARLPIVATRVGAIPDFVEEGRNGWLVEPGDIAGIADALIELVNDPSMARRFGQRSFQIFQERYSWDAVGKKFREHICEALHANTLEVPLAGAEKLTVNAPCR